MNHRHMLLAGLWALSALTAHATPPADPRCPRLPPSSDLAWTYSKGPDFDVCYAQEPGRRASGIVGVYMGHAPNFAPSPEAFVQQGRMEGSPVRWQRMAPEGGAFKLGLETLHEFGHDVSHVWVMANDARRLDELRAVAEGMSFKGL